MSLNMHATYLKTPTLGELIKKREKEKEKKKDGEKAKRSKQKNLGRVYKYLINNT